MTSIIEHCSVAWGGHANNCSVSFSKLLQRMDLADVTLVANGVKIKAHRFVLSTLSPYFDELFADMPFNERAFGKIFNLLNKKLLIQFRYFARVSFQFQTVILKDVTHQTLHDLITFIYHGNVKVKREHYDDFFKTAKSLKIKGLTEAESSFSKTFSSTTPHTPLQLQSTNTIRAQTLEKVSSSNNGQSAQSINDNDLKHECHANADVRIKTEKGKDNRQLVTNGLEADGANKDSNNNGQTVEQTQQLSIKRERPSKSIHATEIAPIVKRAKRLNLNGN